MRNRKKHLRNFIFLSVLLLFCGRTAAAQPTCWAHFNPWNVCERSIQSKEFVFVGRVSTISEKTGDQFNDPLKITVKIEKSLKGKLAPQIELYLDQRCFGRVALDQRYIFTAGRVENEKISGFYSDKLSNALDEKYSESDLKEIFAEIDAIVKKIKQPRLSGTVVEEKSAGSGRYLIASSEVKKFFSPDYILPLADVSVTAKRQDDGQVFKTVTDNAGAFVFEDLPSGKYEVFPTLAKEYNVMAGGTIDVSKDGHGIAAIYDEICGTQIIFNAQKQGSINLRVENAARGWSHIILHLWRVHTINGKDEFSEFFYDAAPKENDDPSGSSIYSFDYHFKNVPAGKYLVMLSVTTDPAQANRRVYYPGTAEEKKAAVIKIEAGSSLNLELDLSELPQN